MEFKAAIKALARRKAVVLFQCLGLVFGLATVLLCVNLLGVLYQNPAIPGVHCGSAVKRLVLERDDGHWSQRFTHAQANALSTALPDAVLRYASLGFDVQAGTAPPRRSSVIAIDPAAFERMCVGTASGQWPAENRNHVVVPAEGAVSGTVRIGAGRYEVSGTNDSFFGLQGTARKALYVPFSSLAHAGLDTAAVGLPAVTLLLDVSGPDANARRQRLDEVVARNPALFGVRARLATQGILPISAQQARRLDGFARILAGVGVAFMLLGLLTVMAYQFGRLGSLASNLSLMRELGAPWSACMLYCIVEPAGIFLVAIAGAIPVELLMRAVLMDWLGVPASLAPDGGVYAASIGTILLVCAASSLLTAWVVLRVARGGVGRRTRRLIQRTFQYVSGVQVAACMFAIVPATAALFAYAQAMPAERAYDIDDVRVHTMFLALDMLPAEFAARSTALLADIDAQVGGRSAIATTAFPLPGEGSWDAAVNFQGRSHRLELNTVTASYFDVLRLEPVRGRLFEVHDQPANTSGWPVVAVANRAAAEVLGVTSLPSGPVTIGKETSAYRATVSIIGIVDEKTSGTNAAGSNDRLGPALYTPWKPNGPFLLMVRHPPRMDAAAVDEAVWRALDRHLPVWRRAEIPDAPVSLEALYKQATAPQRTLFHLFGTISLGAMLLSFAGLLGGGLMTLALHRRSHAIKYTLGATRHRLVREHLLVAAAPLAVGLALATLVGAAAMAPIADLLGLADGTATVVLGGAFLLVLVFSAVAVAISCRGLLVMQVGPVLGSE